jgi:hypothetical protein
MMAVSLAGFFTAGSEDLVYLFSVWIGYWLSAAGDRLHHALFRFAKKVTASPKLFLTYL